jgi:CDP-diacylglycerol--glycerol-3-phosphate 3-phosphatidyltransferase
MVAIGFLTMDWPGGTLLLWSAVAITLYSGYEYVRDYARSR